MNFRDYPQPPERLTTEGHIATIDRMQNDREEAESLLQDLLETTYATIEAQNC